MTVDLGRRHGARDLLLRPVRAPIQAKSTHIVKTCATARPGGTLNRCATDGYLGPFSFNWQDRAVARDVPMPPRKPTPEDHAIREHNRANARHATGPRTDGGKAKSSRKAPRHGLDARDDVEAALEAQEWSRRSALFAASLKPKNAHETALVELIAAAFVRLDRIDEAEAQALERTREACASDVTPMADESSARALRRHRARTTAQLTRAARDWRTRTRSTRSNPKR